MESDAYSQGVASQLSGAMIRDTSGNADHDFTSLTQAALEDIQRKGLRARVRARLHRDGSQPKVNTAENADLVRKVMETGAGDNKALAEKIRQRFLRAKIPLPAVEVRFSSFSLETMVPVSAGGGGGGLPNLYNDAKSKVTGIMGLLPIKPKVELRPAKLLDDLSGVLQPGRITLLLGPPGSGKTTFMKALMRNIPPNLQASGEITYNGHALDEFNVIRTARYVDQHDIHYPLLTVRETLDFSAACQGGGTAPALLRMLEEREKELGITPDESLVQFMRMATDTKTSLATELTLQLLSLANCSDTIVGDAMHRGVSGGERKRVTSGEMMVGPSRVLFMDEISTGLDSASTFTIVQSLANWAHIMQATIMVALLQPEPQTYDLFDDIMLMSNGHIIYHGPRENVPDYFSAIGFQCPPNKGIADFLQELTSRKDQAAIRVDRDAFHGDKDFVSSRRFAEHYKTSAPYRHWQELLAVPYEKTKSHPGALMRAKYGVPGWDAMKALYWRETILFTRNRRELIYRWTQILFLAFCGSTLFLRENTVKHENVTDGRYALDVIFFSVAYMQFLGLADNTEAVLRLPVFFKQRRNLFFPAWAYAVPTALQPVPRIFIEVTAWSLIVYWTAGLAKDAGRFFIFWATLVILNFLGSALYRFIGNACRAVVFSISVCVLTMLVMFLSCGFTLLKGNIPSWWIWVYWISPLQYALTSLSVNELTADEWNVPDPQNPSVTLGQAVLDAFDMPNKRYWRWLGFVVLLGYAIMFNLLNIALLSWLKPPPARGMPPAAEEDIVAAAPAAGAAAAAAKVAEDGKPADGLAAPVPAATDRVAVDVVANAVDKNQDDGTLTVPASAIVEPTKPVGGKSGSTSALPFDPMFVTFRDVHYFVKNPAGSGELELLKGISGAFRPGVLTALMGASGAGKTTLMDVLAGRKTGGRITGDMIVNGHPKEQAAFARVMGYVEQMDIHSPATTVHEALLFSAALRLGDGVDTRTQRAFVWEVMEMVELDVLAGAMVGFKGVFGLSTEQFKRLTIGVELVANPSVIFMDEPTSGLDARAAAIVMRSVRKIVNDGRTVVCTIHQPSAEIFLAFDELLLLKRGGWVIYAGPLGEGSSHLIEYLQAIPGVAPLKANYNPATWMLEVSTLAEEERLGIDFAEIFAQSEPSKRNDDLVAEHSQPPPGSKPLSTSNAYAAGLATQYKQLLFRFWTMQWRGPHYNNTRTLITILTGFLVGSLYWRLGQTYDTVYDVTNVMGALFTSVMFLGLVNFIMVIPMVSMERGTFYRERAAHMYAVFPYTMAMMDVEIPYITVNAMVYSMIVYWMIWFRIDAGLFFFFFLVMWLSLLYFTYWGVAIVALTPDATMAVTTGAAFQGLWFIFNGFLIAKPAMPPWWQWYYYLVPPAWSLYAMVTSQLGDQFGPIDVGGRTMTVSAYISDAYDFEHNLRWMAIGILIAFVLLFRVVASIAFRVFNWQKR